MLPEDDESFVVAYSPKSERLNRTMIMKAEDLKVRAKLGWTTHWIPIPELPVGKIDAEE